MRHLYQFDVVAPQGSTLTLGTTTDNTGITLILMDSSHHQCLQMTLSDDEFNQLCDLRYKLELDSPIRFQHLRLTTV